VREPSQVLFLSLMAFVAFPFSTLIVNLVPESNLLLFS
jgi:hypothetical protein